jgi:uncharacterized protein YcbK (DUF882 family)
MIAHKSMPETMMVPMRRDDDPEYRQKHPMPCGMRSSLVDQRTRSSDKRSAHASAKPLKLSPFAHFAAGLMALTVVTWGGLGRASAETRALDIQHLHTGEHEVIVFKRDGVYDKAGIDRLNHILRDWRRNEEVHMDPELFDLLWTVYRQTGASGPIQIVCGYRAPETNNMLRSRSRGVAKFSQHTLGKAIDFFMPGVPLEKLRETGMRLQVGGVGFYPTSGSPFVHMDTGSVRAWPRMSREQLVRLFPDGKTLHLPSDGGPLPGYQQALAEYQARHGSSAATMVADNAPQRGKGNLLASLFGIKSGEDEDEGNTAPAAVPQKAAPVQTRVAAAPLPAPQPPAETAKPMVVASLPMPPARNPLFDGSKPQLTPVALTVANVPMPPPAAPRNAGAIWQNRAPAQPNPEAVAELKSIDMPQPEHRPSNVMINAPKPRPTTSQLAALSASAHVEDAFSALTGAPKDDASNGMLGYAPASAPQLADSGTAPRDPAGRLKLASLGGSDLAAAAQQASAKQARARDDKPRKANRADQIERLVSSISDGLDVRLIDTTSATRAAAVSRLVHPDQTSVPQMIVKPREVLASASFSATSNTLATGRFAGPAVVALPTVETN